MGIKKNHNKNTYHNSYLVFIDTIRQFFYIGYDSIDNDSARAALFKKITRKLDQYYAEHHKYPISLDKLMIEYYPDGSNANMIKAFEYESDGNYFTFSYHHKIMNTTYIRKGESGKLSFKQYAHNN